MSENMQSKRWQRILALPDDAVVYDQFTGKRYVKGHLQPKYFDSFNQNLHGWFDSESEEFIGANDLFPVGETPPDVRRIVK